MYVTCLSRNGRSLFVPQHSRYYHDSLNTNLYFHYSPTFIIFRVPPAAALARPDRMILRAGRSPLLKKKNSKEDSIPQYF